VTSNNRDLPCRSVQLLMSSRLW